MINSFRIMPKLSLEKLILSLSQGELRAFSLSIKKDKNPSYYTLFNAIRSGKYNDQQKKDNNEIQRRNYLYNNILESLVKSSRTIDSQIAKGLHHLEILHNRQLNKEAWKELEKVEKLANKHERFGYVIQILEWKKILGVSLGAFSDEDYNAVSISEKETMDKYKMYLLAANSYHKLAQKKQNHGYLHGLNNLPDFEYLQTIDNTTLPKRTLYFQRMAKAIHLCLTQDIPAQYDLTKLIVEDAAVINEANECLQAYFEHLTSCICMGYFEELLELFQKLKLDIKKGKFGSSPNIGHKLFYYAANYEIMSYAYMGNPSQLKLKIKEVELGISKRNENLSTEIKITIYSALKMGHYFLGNVAETKHYVNLIMNTENINRRRDTYQDALFFSLIVSTDTNNVSEMEETLQKIMAQGDLEHPQYIYEKRLFEIFQKFCNDQLNKAELFDLIIQANNKSRITLPSGVKYAENYFGYYLWARSKKEHKNVLDIAKEINNYKN
ncbi:MAG: hypothetical protein ACI9GM_000187 [Salibacteraceae bacterium]